LPFRSRAMTCKRPSPDGSITTIFLPLFPVTLASSQKSQHIFTLSNSHNIVTKVETYKTGRRHSVTTVSGSAIFGSTASSPQDVSGAGVDIATKNALKRITVPAYRSAATVSRSIETNIEGADALRTSSSGGNCITPDLRHPLVIPSP